MKVVFTNGCFDIIHRGHITLLERARSLGDKLIVGINSDESVRSIKGTSRPINTEQDRSEVLLGLSAVDEVRIFNELTPENLIKEIKPNVLVKGGDWNTNEIIGANFVKDLGGEVFSIPLEEGYSTSNLLLKLKEGITTPKTEQVNASDNEIVFNALNNHIEVFQKVISEQISEIEKCGEIILKAVSSEQKIMFCGNGGSASDAQHLAAELVGRYEAERKALAAIALTTDTSILTAVANDYDFQRVFARQIEALGREGDVLVAISTSGNSPNVIQAVMTARNLGCKVIGLTGENGKKLASLCDACIMISADRTSRIQEAHITIGHIWCEMIDNKFRTI